MASAAAADAAPAPAAAPAAPAASDYSGPDTVTAKTSDGKDFVLVMSFMSSCKFLKMSFDSMEEAPEGFTLPIKERCLVKIAKFAEYHWKNPSEKSVIDERFVIDHFKEFDKSFSKEMREDIDLLFETIAAVEYLQYPYLLDVLCRCAALLIKGKPKEDVLKILNITTTEEGHKDAVQKHPFVQKYL